MSTQVIILAAGQGKRMCSRLPKVLHHLAGKPMLLHVIATAKAVAPESKPIIIYGHQGELVQQALKHLELDWARQDKQLGTGHAVHQALPFINDEAQVLILSGDVPLISVATLDALIKTTPVNALGMLTANVTNPTGYGRVKRVAEAVTGIVEEKDATAAERDITEINAGIYYVPAKLLKKWLPDLKNNNAQGEYYLTDIIVNAVNANIPIHTLQPERLDEISGVNSRMQLANLERSYHQQYADKLMQQGVTIIDPARVDFRGNVETGQDVTIDINVIFEGRVVLGNGCIIGPNCILKDVVLGDRVEVKANSMIEGAEIGDDCSVGPFARIRPGTKLASHAHIGNFVELKNTTVDEGSKINHLSYIGDSELGKRVNIGAGTITCNYDGANKHKTIIGDDVHVGSDSQLVAPVSIGAGATIGAGSTIIKNVNSQSLTLTQHIDQRIVKAWIRPEKTK
jgi:bifunctional UDP-N-acetylglucosamine pyrophosphorylase/glucosamine-1-phosphate N-acetyltransferase